MASKNNNNNYLQGKCRVPELRGTTELRSAPPKPLHVLDQLDVLPDNHVKQTYSLPAKMANNKPLPQPPRRSTETSSTDILGPTLLSTDGRLHRSRLIRHIFDDIEDQGIQTKKEAWLLSFEEALDELGLAIITGGWISGLRRGRLAQDKARQSRLQRIPGTPGNLETNGEANVIEGFVDNQLPQKPTPLERLRQLVSRQPSSKDSTSSTSSPSPVDAEGSPQGEPHTDLKLVSGARESVAGRQDQLPTPSAKPPTPLHLLLCVSSHGYRRPIPLEDSGFDIIPANIGCSFASGVYTLQNDDGSNILFGLHEWEGVHNPWLHSIPNSHLTVVQTSTLSNSSAEPLRSRASHPLNNMKLFPGRLGWLSTFKSLLCWSKAYSKSFTSL